MLRHRLLEAKVEDNLWPTQFGFRRGASTEQAIYVARRRIERYVELVRKRLALHRPVDALEVQQLRRRHDELPKSVMALGQRQQALPSMAAVRPALAW